MVSTRPTQEAIIVAGPRLELEIVNPLALFASVVFLFTFDPAICSSDHMALLPKVSKILGNFILPLSRARDITTPILSASQDIRYLSRTRGLAIGTFVRFVAFCQWTISAPEGCFNELSWSSQHRKQTGTSRFCREHGRSSFPTPGYSPMLRLVRLVRLVRLREARGMQP